MIVDVETEVTVEALLFALKDWIWELREPSWECSTTPIDANVITNTKRIAVATLLAFNKIVLEGQAYH